MSSLVSFSFFFFLFSFSLVSSCTGITTSFGSYLSFSYSAFFRLQRCSVLSKNLLPTRRHNAAAAPTQRSICSRTEHQDSSRALLSSQDRPLTAPAAGHPQLKASQGDAKMQGQYRRCSALATRTSRLTVPCIPEEYAIRLWCHDDRHFRHSIHADCPSSFKPFLSCHRQLSKT